MIADYCFKLGKTSLFSTFGNILVKIIHIMSQVLIIFKFIIYLVKIGLCYGRNDT